MAWTTASWLRGIAVRSTPLAGLHELERVELRRTHLDFQSDRPAAQGADVWTVPPPDFLTDAIAIDGYGVLERVAA